MADYYIENEQLKAGINIHGAELRSLVRKSDGREYMWSGDAKYWNRVSPVLFPFVGALNGKKYIYDGTEYTGIPQHGFARDNDFVLAEQEPSKIWFELKATDETKKIYPFDFNLRLGYSLEGNKLHIMWTVVNTDSKEIYFSIGAHPAFMCGGPEDDIDTKVGYSLNMHKNTDSFVIGRINDAGVKKGTEEISAAEGVLNIENGFFDKGVFIFDSDDIHTISMQTPDGKPYLAVHFDAPQVGIWAPKGNAPFVCIEPWFGRCDSDDYAGTLQEREYGNSLPAGHSFNKEYVVEIL